MKVRCPHCKQIFAVGDGRNAQACPSCSKTVLLPRFFGDKKVPDINPAVLQREAMRRRQAAGVKSPGTGFVFMQRPMRTFMVIALLVVFGGALLRRARDPRELSQAAQIEQAVRNLTILRIAVERFHTDCGRYPSTHEGLASLLVNPGLEGWRGPYILGLLPDPWRRQFQYVLENGEPLVFSLGPDGIAGTEHDLVAGAPPPEEIVSGDQVFRVRNGVKTQSGN